jgi:hypothetical protein
MTSIRSPFKIVQVRDWIEYLQDPALGVQQEIRKIDRSKDEIFRAVMKSAKGICRQVTGEGD